MIPPVPYAVRITMTLALLSLAVAITTGANGLAAFAQWISPEVGRTAR